VTPLAVKSSRQLLPRLLLQSCRLEQIAAGRFAKAVDVLISCLTLSQRCVLLSTGVLVHTVPKAAAVVAEELPD
jgi:hypothetical protein